MEPVQRTEVAIILSTTPRGGGEKISRILVEEHLAACVNLMETRSFFLWKGNLEREEEDLLIIKTVSERLPETIRRIREIHPYEIPEMIVLPVVAGNEPYLQWVRKEILG
ncbi:MAG: divalent-cation tolerance protein CutA [Methanomicrobiales archaeon]|nr:divalent-cation tolerance protein CutA [Methanomicrobiales archaeon]